MATGCASSRLQSCQQDRCQQPTQQCHQPQQSDSKVAPPDKPAATRQQAVSCAVQAMMHIDVQEAAKERVATQKAMMRTWQCLGNFLS